MASEVSHRIQNLSPESSFVPPDSHIQQSCTSLNPNRNGTNTNSQTFHFMEMKRTC